MRYGSVLYVQIIFSRPTLQVMPDLSVTRSVTLDAYLEMVSFRKLTSNLQQKFEDLFPAKFSELAQPWPPKEGFPLCLAHKLLQQARCHALHVELFPMHIVPHQYKNQIPLLCFAKRPTDGKKKETQWRNCSTKKHSQAVEYGITIEYHECEPFRFISEFQLINCFSMRKMFHTDHPDLCLIHIIEKNSS